MDNSILVESFGRTNVQHRLWYAMEEKDLFNIKVQFGDRAYVLKEGKMYYIGNDDNWYSEVGTVVL